MVVCRSTSVTALFLQKEAKSLAASSQAGLGAQSFDTDRKMKELRGKEQKLVEVR